MEILVASPLSTEVPIEAAAENRPAEQEFTYNRLGLKTTRWGEDTISLPLCRSGLCGPQASVSVAELFETNHSD